MADDQPLWDGLRFSDFRRSDNIEDRRGDSALQNWGGALYAGLMNQFQNGASMDEIKMMLRHPMTQIQNLQPPIPPSTNPLAIEAGVNDVRRIK